MSVSARSLSRWLLPVACAVGGLLGAGCQSASSPPLRAREQPVDLPRFMGDWYVIAHLPVFIEKNAHNAVENYALRADGAIATTFTFNAGAPGGPRRAYHPVGYVRNRATNAEWGMQFIWPFKATYLIVYLDDAYETTIISVPDRRYAWVMARTPEISAEHYAAMVHILRETGHDLTRLRRVPQAPHGR